MFINEREKKNKQKNKKNKQAIWKQSKQGKNPLDENVFSLTE